MSALAFRNVDASPEDPVSEWPQEAIQTALERGGLAHWRRLAAAIRAEPWGPVARRVEEVLAYSRPYGVAAGIRASDRPRRARPPRRRSATAVAAEIDRLVRPIRGSPRGVRVPDRHLGVTALDLRERQGDPVGRTAAADATRGRGRGPD